MVEEIGFKFLDNSLGTRRRICVEKAGSVIHITYVLKRAGIPLHF